MNAVGRIVCSWSALPLTRGLRGVMLWEGSSAVMRVVAEAGVERHGVRENISEALFSVSQRSTGLSPGCSVTSEP